MSNEDNKKKEFYVYIDRTADDGTVFYVGKGSGNRVKYAKRNRVWDRIVKKYGWSMENREIVFITENEQEAFNEEIRLITEYKTFRKYWKDGSGWGANLTIGGDGAAGQIWSERSKDKMRGEKNPMFGKTGNKNPMFYAIGIKSPSFGKKRSEEHKHQISVANSGKNNGMYGIISVNRKLTIEQAQEIRKRHANGESSRKLAKIYKVCKTTILNIINNKIFRNFE